MFAPFAKLLRAPRTFRLSRLFGLSAERHVESSRVSAARATTFAGPDVCVVCVVERFCRADFPLVDGVDSTRHVAVESIEPRLAAPHVVMVLA